jgi:hypothetical protein
MDAIVNIRAGLPNPDNTMIDAEIWHKDSHELRDLAETIVDRQPRFAWMVVEAWLTKHSQFLIDKK